MPIENHIRESLRLAVSKRLAPLINMCHWSGFFGDETIELSVKEHEGSPSTAAVLRLNVMDESREVQIPTIFFFPAWRGKRIGMALLTDIFRVCERYGYRLFIVQMVGSFHQYMHGLGVRNLDSETVEIVDSTRLRPCGLDEPCRETEPYVIPDPLCFELEEIETALTAGKNSHRSTVFAQIEKGGIVNIVEEGEIVETIETLEQIDDLWGWSSSGDNWRSF